MGDARWYLKRRIEDAEVQEIHARSQLGSLRDVLAALVAAESWQPMETAPKDGTWVLGRLRPLVEREREPFEVPAVVVQWRADGWTDGHDGYTWNDELTGWRAIPRGEVGR